MRLLEFVEVLLLKSLESMRELGYAYSIIGWPAKSAVDFYKKCVDAVMIDAKSSGIYKRMIEIRLPQSHWL